MEILNTQLTKGRYALVKNGVVYNIITDKDFKKYEGDECLHEITEDNCDKMTIVYKKSDNTTESVTYYFDKYIVDGDLFKDDKFVPNDDHNKKCKDDAIITDYFEFYQNKAMVEIVNRMENSNDDFDKIMESMPLYLRFGVGDFEKAIGGYVGIESIEPKAINITKDNEDLLCMVLDLAKQNAIDCGNAIANKIGYSVKEETIVFTNGEEEVEVESTPEEPEQNGEGGVDDTTDDTKQEENNGELTNP